MASGLDDKYVLFEFLDAETVTLRRSDMDYPDIRRQFLVLLSSFLGVEMTADEWRSLLGRIFEAVCVDCHDCLSSFALSCFGNRLSAWKPMTDQLMPISASRRRMHSSSTTMLC